MSNAGGFTAGNHLRIAMLALYEGNVPTETEGYKSSKDLDVYIYFPSAGMPENTPKEVLAYLRTLPAVVARNAGAITAESTPDGAAKKEVEIKLAQFAIDRKVQFEARLEEFRANQQKQDFADRMGSMSATSAQALENTRRRNEEIRRKEEQERFQAFLQRSVAQANPMFNPDHDLINRVDARYRAEDLDRYMRMSGMERFMSDLIHETLWLMATLPAHELAILNMEARWARMSRLTELREAARGRRIMDGLARGHVPFELPPGLGIGESTSVVNSTLRS